MKNICFLAQFPPPIHGLSKAVQTLYDSRLNAKYSFSKIDITRNSRIFGSICKLVSTKADVIYFTISQTRFGNLRDLFFLLLIHIRKKACIIHLHGGYYRTLVDKDMPKWQSKLNFKFLSHVDGGIVLGNSLKYIFRGMIPDDKIFVCPNCVDDSYIAKSISDKITSTEFSTKLNILYLSNFIPSKGYRKVLELAELFEKNGKEDKFGFHFAGKFFDEKEREYFFNKKAYLKNVVYHGVVSGDSKTKLLEECNIFILLTNYPNEGQPISILEAMGNGMAIITTDHAGIPEIADSTNGLVCKKNDIDLQKVYDYLVECYDNRKKLSSVCVRNYEITKQKYTEGRYIDNMDKIFETVCREK